MGGVSDCGSACLDSDEMRQIRLVLYFLVGFLFSAVVVAKSANAATVAVAMKGLTGTSGSQMLKMPLGSVAANAGSLTTSGVINVAGKMITVPASARIAANAGTVITTALRLNPAAIVGAAVASWLLANGMEYAAGAWNKQTNVAIESSGRCWQPGGYSFGDTLSASACFAAYWQGQVVPGATHLRYHALESVQPSGTATFTYFQPSQGITYSGMVSGLTFLDRIATACPAGTTPNGSQCVGSVPATDADFSALAASPLPDALTTAAAQQLPSGLPVENPIVAPFTEPLGAPRLDPITGRMVQDAARVEQPYPATAPEQLRVTPFTSDAGMVPDQTQAPVAPTVASNEPVTSPEEAEKSALCTLFPNIIACQEMGEAEEVPELTPKPMGGAISPVSVGGSGTCPPDKVVMVSGHSINIPLGQMCSFAGWLKPVIIACAWLAAMGILIGGFKVET